MKRRSITIILVVIVLCIVARASILMFTSVDNTTALTRDAGQDPTPILIFEQTPTPSPIPLPLPTPTPISIPRPILTATQSAPKFNASAVYLLDADTNHVLDDKNGEKPMLMASTTKIMTALIALQTANFNMRITVHQDAINRVILDDGSSAGLTVGEVLPLKVLLYALLLPSGSDAAYAIADGLRGSVPNFVAQMNLLAYRLHLFQTHYNSPDGLTNDKANHYTSAHDLAILSQYAMHIPLFASIVKTQEYTAKLNGQTIVWKNSNTLLGTYPGITGIKTGYTNDSGYCLVFSATNAGHHLIGIILDSPSQVQRDKDASLLLTWGFHLPLRTPQ